MKQKIVFRIGLPACSKCPKKAFMIAAEANGVESIAIGGQHENEMAVTGENVDIVKLAQRLRKKVGCADVISVSLLK